jgi:tRNA 2-selenouridine synthase
LNETDLQNDATMINAEDFWQRSSTLVVLDVRSPSEFAKGHLPGAINLPLFDDLERAEVGTIYKNSGRDAAVLRGLKFAGQKMADLVVQAREASAGRKSILVHCWRGGMRSQAVAWLLNVGGMESKVLRGGYKSFRQLVHQQLDRDWPLCVISGLTGAGKTRILKLLAQSGERVLDLEDLANHRGSAFGGISQPDQPTTEQFENQLFASLQQLESANRIWVEDEGNRIGTVVVPSQFHHLLRHAPAIFLESSVRQRVENLVVDYGDLPIIELETAIEKIRKRLGFQHAEEALASLRGGNVMRAIEIVLEYYDKTYLKAANSMPRDEMPKLAIDELADAEVVQQAKLIAAAVFENASI